MVFRTTYLWIQQNTNTFKGADDATCTHDRVKTKYVVSAWRDLQFADCPILDNILW
jgi:hypothetical protein